jgi:hypothetical protein
MTCWEILGIDPTDDKEQIRQAYESQSKFAAGEEAERLRRAYQEAMGGQPAAPEKSVAKDPGPVREVGEGGEPVNRSLSADEEEVVHDVIIQVNALLNDSGRSHDVMIWKAILCEPPADRLPLRREIASRLENKVRPMAENGSFPVPVVHFLAEWFDWYSLKDKPPHPLEGRDETESAAQERHDEEPGTPGPPEMQNFWPAVIGWIVGLLILASLFGGMGSGG